jgi:hypothetical protein
MRPIKLRLVGPAGPINSSCSSFDELEQLWVRRFGVLGDVRLSYELDQNVGTLRSEADWAVSVP